MLLKVLLGVDYRSQSVVGAAARRRATFEAISQALADGDGATGVLERYSHIGRHPGEVALALHRAFVWELLSLGLALAFSMLLVEQRKGLVVRRLRRALAGRPRRPPLGQLSGDDEGAADHVVGLLRAALNQRPDRLDLDTMPTRLAHLLVGDCSPNVFLERLVDRHHLVKPDGAWIALSGDKVLVLAPKKSLTFSVRPRTYRLDAYHQILRDIGMIS